MDEFETMITPVLMVRGAAATVEFYQRAFGAREIYRNAYPDGQIVAEMAVGQARFRVADEAPEAADLSPQTLRGTTVRMNLLVPDPDMVAQHAIANGATEVAPIADQSYGLRQGRLADPFGHHWLIGRPLEGKAGDWTGYPARECQASSSVGYGEEGSPGASPRLEARRRSARRKTGCPRDRCDPLQEMNPLGEHKLASGQRAVPSEVLPDQ